MTKNRKCFLLWRYVSQLRCGGRHGGSRNLRAGGSHLESSWLPTIVFCVTAGLFFLENFVIGALMNAPDPHTNTRLKKDFQDPRTRAKT